MKAERRTGPYRGNYHLTDGWSELRFLSPNGPLATRETLRTTMDSLFDLGLNAEDAINVELVLAEVLNNVSKHAYSSDPDGLIELRLLYRPEALSTTVCDRGRPLPGGTAPSVNSPPHSDATRDLPEGGFGWFLIRTLTRNVAYRRESDRNILQFEIALERTSQSDENTESPAGPPVAPAGK